MRRLKFGNRFASASALTCALVVVMEQGAGTQPISAPVRGLTPIALGAPTQSVVGRKPIDIARAGLAAVQEPEVVINKASLARQKSAYYQRANGRSSQLLVVPPLPSLPLKTRPLSAPGINAAMAKTAITPQSFVGATRVVRPTPPSHSISNAVVLAAPPPRPAGPKNKLTADLAFNGYIERVVPPDMQISVGESVIVQVDNANVAIWRKDAPGVPVRPPFQLQNTASAPTRNGIFDAPKGWVVCDPWIVFDPASRRWLMSALAYNHADGDSEVLLAVSAVNDPSSWHVRPLYRKSGLLHDQPKINVTSDKVVVAWNEFAYIRGYADPYENLGGEWVVLSRANVEDTTAPLEGEGQFVPDSCHPNPLPVRTLSETSTAYIVATVPPDSDPSCQDGLPAPAATTGDILWLVRIDGPALSPAMNAFDVPISPYVAPPNVLQEGSLKPVNAGDTHVISAAWRNGTLWAAANGSCFLSGSVGSRGCFRLIQVDTAALHPIIRYDKNIVSPDRHLLFPAVSVNSYGDVFASVLQVSETSYLGAAAFSQLSHNGDWLLQTFGSGQAALNCPTEAGSLARIGDYSGVDVDPVQPTKFWAAAQFASSSEPISGGQMNRASCYEASRLARFIVR